MAEINQPAPIKPVWPTRKEQQPVKKRQITQTDDDEERERRQRKHQDSDQRPAIDEYA